MNKLQTLRRCLPASLSLLPVSQLLLLSMLLLVSSCQRKVEYDRRLLQAEQVVEEHPDSALDLLNAVDAALLSRADSALYGLLRAQALYKCYLPVSADTLLPQAIRFFEQSGDRRLGLCYFYYGAIIYEQGLTSDAVLSFKKAEDIGRTQRDTILLKKTTELLQRVNYAANNVNLSMFYARQLLELSTATNDSGAIGRSLLYMASTSFDENNMDTCTSYAQRAMSYMQYLVPRDKASLLSVLGYYSFLRNDFETAKQYLFQSLDIYYLSETAYTLLEIYRMENHSDDAMEMWDRAINDAGMHLKYALVYEKGEYLKSKKRFKEALETIQMSDSMKIEYLQEIKTAEITELQHQYDHERLEAGLYRYRSQVLFLALALLSLFVIIVVSYFTYIRSLKRSILSSQMELKGLSDRICLWEDMHKTDMQVINRQKEERNAMVLKMEKLKNDIQKKQETLRRMTLASHSTEIIGNDRNQLRLGKQKYDELLMKRIKLSREDSAALMAYCEVFPSLNDEKPIDMTENMPFKHKLYLILQSIGYNYDDIGYMLDIKPDSVRRYLDRQKTNDSKEPN